MRKPGYKTSEFWLTLISFIFSGLFLFGVIKEPDTKDELIDVFGHVTESVILLGGQAIVLARYIRKRKEEKIEYERTKQKEADIINKDLENYIGVDRTIERVNINKASIGELIQLPHIGPVTANSIISHRTEQGKFTKLEEIKQVSGIGESIYLTIEPYIVL